jgi:ABC-type transporter Mla MlaB component
LERIGRWPGRWKIRASGHDVVFSFFKKDSKDGKPGSDRGEARTASKTPRADVKGRPLSGPVNRSLNRATNVEQGGFAVTENAVPDRESARAAAMATAAKIDAIESEMARDFLRPKKAPGEPPTVDPNREVIAVEAAAPPPEPEEPAPPPPPPPAPPAAGKRGGRGAAVEEDEGEEIFDPGTDVLMGSINAIEVDGGNSSSVLDETAILFANKQDQAAESGLRAALVAESLGAATERGWLMLLELMQQRGDRQSFEQLSTQFALRFSVPAPSWISYADTEVRPAAPRGGLPVVKLPPTIDASIVKPLEEFKTLASTHPALGLDVSATREIDLVGAELLLRVLNAFKRASHELTLHGAEQLLVALRSAVEPGRRDPTDAAWMLLLEVQRLLNRQADFEETGIQYCITYEVSPPSWEPPLSNIRVEGAVDKPAVPAAAATAADPLNWKGEMMGDGEPFLGHLVAASRTSRQIVIECRQLRRMAFSAGSALLGQLFRLQQGGVNVEFRNVNCLVAALWQLLGVSAVCDVRVRRA